VDGFEPARLERLRDVMTGHVEHATVGGVAWLAARGDEVEVGVAGALSRGEPHPVRPDSILRISSMTKPVVAVGALILVEECRLRLEDPIDDLLPELADRRVLVDPRGSLEGETVPARAPITVRDVLTSKLGLGMDFEAPWPQPLLEAMGALGLGDGPPQPQVPPEPDEWLRRLSTLPLLYQPGEQWLYNTSSDVLGVLVSRASGRLLDAFLRDRVFTPLGTADTGFATRRTGLVGVGTYGWAGGLGTSWANDPDQQLVGLVLTTDMFGSAFPPPASIRDFWTCVYAALEE
jgi:CubicO group peptidase (beta-lactamase class C family)